MQYLTTRYSELGFSVSSKIDVLLCHFREALSSNFALETENLDESCYGVSRLLQANFLTLSQTRVFATLIVLNKSHMDTILIS
jgi:hypothetical protein